MNTTPTRIPLPDGSTVEIINVQVLHTLRTGGSWTESVSLTTWQAMGGQGNVREELRDSGGGGDREG